MFCVVLAELAPIYRAPSKHDALIQSCLNGGPLSATLPQHSSTIGQRLVFYHHDQTLSNMRQPKMLTSYAYGQLYHGDSRVGVETSKSKGCGL